MQRNSPERNIHVKEDKWWDAVCRRDRSVDGKFVYAVRSTGVYCRPGCPSRLAMRRNVLFFRTPSEAGKAGFRPCRRCSPDKSLEAIPHADAISQACERMRQEGNVPLKALANAAGLSPGHFQRLFKAHAGLSPKQYALALRRHQFLNALSDCDSVTNAIFDSGYGSSSKAYADSDFLGMHPRKLLKGGAGELLRYTFVPTSLGEMLAAVAQKGICFLEFGRRTSLRKKLSERFPKASVRHDESGLAALAARIATLIEISGDVRGIPIDIRGTFFQQRVWRELRKVTSGNTISYAELAENIGCPGGARAVAGACAANTIAVVVPCHRAVCRNGDISGYRWGVERKKTLLKRESDARKT